MKDIVVICQAYTQINNAVYLLNNNWQQCSITLIILNLKNLNKFFKVVNEKVYDNTINVIFIERFKVSRVPGRKIINKFYVIPDIIREKQYLKTAYNKYFFYLKGAQVFFSSRHFSDYALYMLRKIDRSNNLTYIPDPAADLLPLYTSQPSNITDFVRLCICKLVFSWDIGMVEFLGSRFPIIPEKFMLKKVHRIVSREERDIMLKDVNYSNFNIFNADKYDVIYFGHNAKGVRASQDVLKYELDKVFSLLNKFFTESKIASKYHPGRVNDTIIKVGVILEDYIPAQFLINKTTKLFISIFSTSLTHVEKGTVVSLLDLISVRDQELKRSLKERLIKASKEKILFPKSLDELEKILITKNPRNNSLSVKD